MGNFIENDKELLNEPEDLEDLIRSNGFGSKFSKEPDPQPCKLDTDLVNLLDVVVRQVEVEQVPQGELHPENWTRFSNTRCHF